MTADPQVNLAGMLRGSILGGKNLGIVMGFLH